MSLNKRFVEELIKVANGEKTSEELRQEAISIRQMFLALRMTYMKHPENMAHQFPFNIKNCATCAYWAGARSTNFYGEYSVTADYTSFGKCLHQTNGWHNQDRQACFICPAYEKWAALKK